MRGQKSGVGDERVAENGYHYTKTETKWTLTHHLIAEQALGRKLDPDERVSFKDGKRDNLDPDNIQVSKKARGSLRRRKAQLEARLAEIQGEIDQINEELARV